MTKEGIEKIKEDYFEELDNMPIGMFDSLSVTDHLDELTNRIKEYYDNSTSIQTQE